MIAVGIAVATVVAFVISSAFYSLAPTGDATTANSRPAVWQIGVELLRSAIVAGLVSGLLAAGDWHTIGTGALLGLALWALPVILLTGSVTWEGVPVRSAALHAADWLLKLVIIGMITGVAA